MWRGRKEGWGQIRSVLKIYGFLLKCTYLKANFLSSFPLSLIYFKKMNYFSTIASSSSLMCLAVTKRWTHCIWHMICTFLGPCFAYSFSWYLKYFTSLQHHFCSFLFKIQFKLFFYQNTLQDHLRLKL